MNLWYQSGCDDAEYCKQPSCFQGAAAVIGRAGFGIGVGLSW